MKTFLLISTILLGVFSTCHAKPNINEGSGKASELNRECPTIMGMNGMMNNKGNCVYRDDDMIMTEDQMLEAFGLAYNRNAQTNPTQLWTNGVIPIRFDSSVISEDEEQVVMDVADKFNAQMGGCLSMVPWSDQENYVMVINDGSGCWSHLGMRGREQQLSLGCFPGNFTENLIVHEFIHAFGFAHEQSRPDRDQYVEIVWDNIREDAKNIYAIMVGSHTYGVMYDGTSVMHYYSTFFSNGNGDTMKSLRPDLWTTEQLGYGTWMTDGDVAKLRMNYECDGPNCGGVLTDTTGTISSPEWPLSYPHHNNCTWTIPCSDSVEITVKNFTLGPTLKLDCFDCDKIEVKLSNHVQQPSWLPSMAGIYEASTPVNGHPAWISGSKALWKSIQGKPKWIFGSASDIGSGYPSNIIQSSISNDTECPHEVSSWEYSCNSGCSSGSRDVSIEFIGRCINRDETEGNCRYHGHETMGLTISDGENSKTFCGTTIETTLTKSGPVEINFSSSSNHGYNGFSLDFSCGGATVSPTPTTTTTPTITTTKKPTTTTKKPTTTTKKPTTTTKKTTTTTKKPTTTTKKPTKKCKDKKGTKKCKKMKKKDKKCKNKKTKKNCKKTCMMDKKGTKKCKKMKKKDKNCQKKATKTNCKKTCKIC